MLLGVGFDASKIQTSLSLYFCLLPLDQDAKLLAIVQAPGLVASCLVDHGLTL